MSKHTYGRLAGLALTAAAAVVALQSAAAAAPLPTTSDIEQGATDAVLQLPAQTQDTIESLLGLNTMPTSQEGMGTGGVSSDVQDSTGSPLDTGLLPQVENQDLLGQLLGQVAL